MRIAFIPGSCIPFHGKTLEERPLGGIETAVIRLANALDKLGHDVFVFTRVENPPLTKPLYIPFRTLEDLNEIDVLIAVREILPLFANIKSKRKYYWTGDSYDQLQNLGLGDRRIVTMLDAALFVSDWQADALSTISGYPRDKTYILRNGVDLTLFSGNEERNFKRLVYTSTPFRGLAHLPKLFSAVRSKVPGAELHVFSGFAVYDGAGNTAALTKQFEPLFAKLRATEGVTVRGNVRQAELSRELMRASILAYPNTFEETSCIAVMEALAAGCAVVTSDRGALSETLGEDLSVIPGMPGTTSYDHVFVERIIALLENQAEFESISKLGLERAKDFDWNKIAAEFTEFLSHRAQAPTNDSQSSSILSGPL